VKYQSPGTYYSKVIAKVKSFQYVGQTPRSRIHGQKYWYPWKGLVTNNTHVKCQSHSTYQSKDIAKVKVFNKKVKHQGQGHIKALALTIQKL
jgi:hypothetical protein